MNLIKANLPDDVWASAEDIERARRLGKAAVPARTRTGRRYVDLTPAYRKRMGYGIGMVHLSYFDQVAQNEAEPPEVTP